MSINENTIIFNKLYRSHYDDKEYFFEEILNLVLIISVIYNTILTEKLQDRHEKFFFCPSYKPTRILNSAVFSAYIKFFERKQKSERKHTDYTGKRSI